MASFSGGGQTPLNAIVADIGHYATKMGWAGDDQPKSYFRSNVAILRDDENSSGKNRSPIVDVRYDYYHRPIQGYNNNNNNTAAAASAEHDLDGRWEVANPVDPVTGLWYNPTTTTATSGDGGGGTSMQDSAGGSSSLSPQSSSSLRNHDTSGADWADLLPHLLRHGYETGLNAGSSANNNKEWNHPLVLSERSYNPPPLRQQVLEILMEEVQVPCVFLARDAVLQCYAVGRTQGTVVDMGDSGTTVTPVYEGYVETHGVQRAPIGLADIDVRVLEHLDQLYAKQQSRKAKSGGGGSKSSSNNNPLGFLPLYQVKQQRDFGWNAPLRRSAPFHDAARLFVAQECRLTGAGVAIDTTSTTQAATGTTAAPTSFQAPHKSFSLPDGTPVSISSQFRFQSAHILFGNPQIVVTTTGDAANASGASATTTQQQQATANSTAANNLPSTPEQEARQALFHKNKQEWTARSKAQEDLMANHQDNADDDGNNALNKSDDAFSDATAVGIAKRRTKRHKKQTTTATSHEKEPPPLARGRAFSNARLNAACSKYLNTFLDQSITSAPIAQMICEAAYNCEREQQPALLQNVILGGGGACVGPTEQAAVDLLREQTERLIHVHTPGWRVKMTSPATAAERSVLAWIGGSILASLGTFHELYVTKADYDEWGTAIVNRKCP